MIRLLLAASAVAVLCLLAQPGLAEAPKPAAPLAMPSCEEQARRWQEIAVALKAQRDAANDQIAQLQMQLQEAQRPAGK